MNKYRMGSLSDGVIAIIITIMVLEFNIPKGFEFQDLKPLIPKFLSYVLSFLYLAIFWNNHHHMTHTIKHISGIILWANFHLLFWLSLIPFTTRWMGENNFMPMPMALYGIILFMAASAFSILQWLIIKNHGPDSILARAVGKDYRGKISLILYSLAIVSCWISQWMAVIIYVLVTFIWLIPDRRIEIIFKEEEVEQQ